MTSEKAPELAEQLASLRNEVTDNDILDGGRYFDKSFRDLTQCPHGDTGNYGNDADGKLVQLLWNSYRAGKLVTADVADAIVAAACEALVKAAGTFCWNRYDESRMKTPAVFTSHTHQRIEEALRQAVPSDARAALAEAERRVWNAALDAAIALPKRKDPLGGQTFSYVRVEEVAALKKEQEACECTKIEQDESCPVGYPSLLCEKCDGKGHQ